METINRITVSIDWAGSSYRQVPPRLTVLADNWQTRLSSAILETLQRVEAGDTNSVVVQEADENTGKVVINQTDEYPYLVTDRDGVPA